MFRKITILVVLLFFIVNTAAFAAPLSEVEAEGNPWWLWLIVFAVLALFAGFMLWWWLHEPDEEEGAATTGHEHAEVSAMPEAAHDDSQVDAAYAGPQDTADVLAEEKSVESKAAAPDDLTIVEGIGPVIQRVLYAAGINTYGDLAAADPDRLEAILKEADVKLARLFDPTTWPEQAQLAAGGNWEELEALKERLIAGRRA